MTASLSKEGRDKSCCWGGGPAVRAAAFYMCGSPRLAAGFWGKHPFCRRRVRMLPVSQLEWPSLHEVHHGL